jgi:hypothetical protein
MSEEGAEDGSGQKFAAAPGGTAYATATAGERRYSGSWPVILYRSPRLAVNVFLPSIYIGQRGQ